ncbi:MAG: RNA 3'-terminal phosphate cyclase [Planctomycetota bacterium]
MISIDGSIGEGGGQVLRSSLSLSMLTGQPVELTHIRSGRKKPGLMRQHLACVRAAKQICNATVEGDALNSTELIFDPGSVQSGDYQFSVGSAGSTCLVLQTVFPTLAMLAETSTVRISGGTHNPLAPSTDFLAKVYAPHVAELGFQLQVETARYGFAPAGGGELSARISPSGTLKGIQLVERTGDARYSARVLLSQLESSIATRELKTVCRRLPIEPEVTAVDQVESSGPGNVVLVEAQHDNCRELICEAGQAGVKAERVARSATNAMRRYIASSAPVGEHLADQLMLPAAIAASHGCMSRVRAQAWTSHCATHQTVIESFLKVRFDVNEVGEAIEWTVSQGES